MIRTLAAVVVAALLGFTSTLAALDQPVTVFVTSAGAANGLTDPSKDNRISASP